MNQGGSVRCMGTHLVRLRYFVVTFISSCILDTPVHMIINVVMLAILPFQFETLLLKI